MEPELVVEVGIDVARYASGRWRHPARWHRARPDLCPADVPCLTSVGHAFAATGLTT
ncbi:ATP-dependent DNA ligase [Streptomyces lutosisoli]|uniref:ATP-dependent DNA ligase n=1 Tax=Streptomyces lutosisoli TaxID=2665721 RepID=UPI003617A3B7